MGSLGSGKGKERISPLEPPGGARPCRHLELSPVRLLLDFLPPEMQDLGLFQATKFVGIYYCSDRKLIHSAYQIMATI